MSISIAFGAIRSLHVLQLKITKKSITPVFWRFKVVEFSGNRKPVCDFLLVLNSCKFVADLVREQVLKIRQYLVKTEGMKLWMIFLG